MRISPKLHKNVYNYQNQFRRITKTTMIHVNQRVYLLSLPCWESEEQYQWKITLTNNNSQDRQAIYYSETVEPKCSRESWGEIAEAKLLSRSGRWSQQIYISIPEFPEQLLFMKIKVNTTCHLGSGKESSEWGKFLLLTLTSIKLHKNNGHCHLTAWDHLSNTSTVDSVRAALE